MRTTLHDFLTRLFPICRSITGNGVRETLRLIQEEIPGLRIHEVPSGAKVFDWTVPDEWNITDARLVGPDGEVVADFADSNLHVVGYSEPVDAVLDLEELQEHLHSLPERPEAIPTSLPTMCAAGVSACGTVSACGCAPANTTLSSIPA